jgi:hypothetical protein
MKEVNKKIQNNKGVSRAVKAVRDRANKRKPSNTAQKEMIKPQQ